MSTGVLLATRNEGKVKEIRYILDGIGILLPGDIGITDKPEEMGQSYFENAFYKARWYCEKARIPTLAEDSGLEIFSLGGFPGIKSARIPDPEVTDEERCKYILLKVSADRSARYVAVCVLFTPEGFWFSSSGFVEGYITDSMRGSGGFGYDPIFFSPELGKTFGEANLDEKCSVSHRARAIRKLVPILQGLMGNLLRSVQ